MQGFDNRICWITIFMSKTISDQRLKVRAVARAIWVQYQLAAARTSDLRTAAAGFTIPWALWLALNLRQLSIEIKLLGPRPAVSLRVIKARAKRSPGLRRGNLPLGRLRSLKWKPYIRLMGREATACLLPQRTTCYGNGLWLQLRGLRVTERIIFYSNRAVYYVLSEGAIVFIL